jgi:cysteinyl-tRNA synthetase
MFEMARATNRAMGDKTLTKKGAERYLALLDEFNGILNILPPAAAADDSMEDVMSILIDLRSELRKRKMYDMADLIRDRLKDAGIVLEDSADGVKWKRARSCRSPVADARTHHFQATGHYRIISTFESTDRQMLNDWAVF